MPVSATHVVASRSRPFARAWFRLGLAAIVLGSFAFATSTAAAQSTAVTSRLIVFTGGNFAGNVNVNYSGALDLEFDAGLGSTPIGGVRYEKAFLGYLAFGGEIVSSFWRPDGGNRRNAMLDFAMTPRFRYRFVLSERFMVEPYIVVPFGFSLAIWNSSVDTMGLDRVNPGLVVGALAGTTFLTRSHVGAMVEFGWIHHVAYDNGSDGSRWTMLMNQIALRAGVVYAF